MARRQEINTEVASGLWCSPGTPPRATNSQKTDLAGWGVWRREAVHVASPLPYLVLAEAGMAPAHQVANHATDKRHRHMCSCSIHVARNEAQKLGEQSLAGKSVGRKGHGGSGGQIKAPW